MTRFLPRFRTTFTAVCGIAAVLLCVLWARSYWTSDGFEGSFRSWDLSGFVDRGQLQIDAISQRGNQAWKSDPAPVSSGARRHDFGFHHGSYGAGAFFPLWVVPTVAVAFASLPWLPVWSKRFSLRTLLILITLVSVLMGTVVYLTNIPITPPVDVGDFGAPGLSR